MKRNISLSLHTCKPAASSPYAAFLLAVVALPGWLLVYREKMHYPAIPYDLDGVYYDDPRQIPPERVRTFAGWDHIPYVCAFTSLNIEAIRGARQVVEHCVDVSMAVATTWNRGAGELLLRRYQELVCQIEDSSRAISDLAGAFSTQGCRLEESNFRAEIGAMLWSLGLLAESQAFRASARPGHLPGRRFFQRLIRQAMDALPYDSLLRYLWLE